IPTASINTYSGSEYLVRDPVSPLCAGTRIISGSAAVDNVFGPFAPSPPCISPVGTAPCCPGITSGLLPADCGICPPGPELGALPRNSIGPLPGAAPKGTLPLGGAP